MKKKLIIQTISNQEPIDHGFDYLHKKCVWLIELHYETEENIMEVIELTPSKKIQLTEVMDIIRQKIDDLIPEGCGDCGYRVYRLKK